MYKGPSDQETRQANVGADCEKEKHVEQITSLKAALAIADSGISCDTVHHAQSDYHKSRPCPVMARYKALKG